MNKSVCNMCLVLTVILTFVLSEGFTLNDRHKRQNGGVSNSTQTPGPSPTRNTTITRQSNDDSSNVGIILGVVLGILGVVAVAAIIIMILVRNKRARDAEYARAAKVQRNSAMNAGVYNDLTTVSPIVKKPLQSEGTEMERLKGDEEEEV